MSTDGRKLNLDAPARYRICAQGIFDACWLEMLSGVWAVCNCPYGGLRVTILMGSVSDQAALFGVLNHLYDLGLPLISVEWLLDAPERAPKSSADRRSPPALESGGHDQPTQPHMGQRSSRQS